MSQRVNKIYVITFYKILEEATIDDARAYADRIVSEGYADGIDLIVPAEVRENNNT